MTPAPFQTLLARPHALPVEDSINHGGQLAGGLIGLAWLILGWWMIAVGRRRGRAGVGWTPAVGTIVDKDGGTEGLFLRNPHIAYAGTDGSQRIVKSGSHGDLWEPGQQVDILVDPARPEHAVLATRAQRGTPYVVIGWFIIGIAVLTLASSWALAVWVPQH